MAGEFLSDEEMKRLEASAEKTASETRAAYAQSHAPRDLLKDFKEMGYRTAQPGIFKDMLNFGTGAIDQLSLENLRYLPDFSQALEQGKLESPKSTTAGQGTGAVGLGIASTAIPGGPALRGIPIGPLIADFLQGVATKPEGQNAGGEDLRRRAVQGGVAPLVGGAVRGAGSLLENLGDRAMQLAVGRNKYTPGVGTELVKAGVGAPTREGMKKQVARKKNATFQKMQGAVAGNQRTAAPNAVADQVRTLNRKSEIPGAQPSSADIPTRKEVDDFALEIEARGQETLPQMMSRRRAAGERGFDNVSDLAKRNLLGKMSKEEQIGYSELIKSLAPEIVPHDRRYSALARAGNALAKDPPVMQGWSVPGLATKAGAAATGVLLTEGNPLGGLAGFALSTPGGQAGAAHLLTRGGQAVRAGAPAAIGGMTNVVHGKKKEKFLTDEEIEAMEAAENPSRKRALKATGGAKK
jgi:hypothetical protein